VLKPIAEGLLVWPNRRITMPSYKPFVTGIRQGRRSLPQPLKLQA
jgi:hypothetical protein